MGIKCLLKFITNKDNIIKNVDKKIYKNKKIAIDISILIYRIIISVRSSGADFTNQKGDITSHILGLFNKTIELLNMGVIPVYVFDGKPPNIKQKTLDARKNIRKKALIKMENAETEDEKIKYFKRSSSITKEQWDQCRELLDMMGIPYINAPEEADSQCAYLAKMGLVDGVLTEDMDILTFGSPKIIRNLTSHKIETSEINLPDILQNLNLTHEQFVEFCILLGSDYSSGVHDLKPQEIYDYYINTKDLEKTIQEFNKNNIHVNDNNYLETKEYFLNPCVQLVQEHEIQLKEPKYHQLLSKLVNDYGLIKYVIKSKLERLKKFYLSLSKM